MRRSFIQSCNHYLRACLIYFGSGKGISGDALTHSTETVCGNSAAKFLCSTSLLQVAHPSLPSCKGAPRNICSDREQGDWRFGVQAFDDMRPKPPFHLPRVLGTVRFYSTALGWSFVPLAVPYMRNRLFQCAVGNHGKPKQEHLQNSTLGRTVVERHITTIVGTPIDTSQISTKAKHWAWSGRKGVKSSSCNAVGKEPTRISLPKKA